MILGKMTDTKRCILFLVFLSQTSSTSGDENPTEESPEEVTHSEDTLSEDKPEEVTQAEDILEEGTRAEDNHTGENHTEANTGYGTCKSCYDGYSGDQCTQPLCFGNTTCANGGTCVSPDTCSCTSDYTGQNCETENQSGSGGRKTIESATVVAMLMALYYNCHLIIKL